MDAKEAYEVAASLAEALPEDRREEFVELLKEVAADDRLAGAAGGVYRWFRDAGWQRPEARLRVVR